MQEVSAGNHATLLLYELRLQGPVIHLTAAASNDSLRDGQSASPRRLFMTPLSALWLPIVLSAVIVFVASSIMHMVLTYHRSNYGRLPDEDKVLDTLRAAGLQRGLYMFPFCTMKEMKSPAAMEKYKRGPVGSL